MEFYWDCFHGARDGVYLHSLPSIRMFGNYFNPHVNQFLPISQLLTLLDVLVSVYVIMCCGCTLLDFKSFGERRVYSSVNRSDLQ
jgi:hypothetical protein